MHINYLTRALALGLTLGISASIGAQGYPAKPIRLVASFAAGGPIDLAARPMAQRLQEILGQPMVVDFRPGANGIIGNDHVAKSAPDGYTLLVVSSAFTINPSSYAKLPYDTLRDFTAVGPFARSDIIFVVNPVVPARNVKEFVALGRARPGKITFGSAGTGGSLHLGGELLKLAAGIDMVHVPYKGAAPALTDVIGGHVDAMFISAPPAIPQAKAGKVRVLAVASPRRMAALPDVPTFEESGWPKFVIDASYGIVAPAGTPQSNIERLNAAISTAAANPELKQRYAASGLEPISSSAQAYSDFLRDEVAKWRKVVIAAKLKPN